MLYTAAENFKALTQMQYNIVIAKKKKAYQITIRFSEDEFFHLAGLHKLTDIANTFPVRRKETIHKILAKKLSLDKIQQSEFFEEIALRLETFASLEDILDSNEIVFKYNKRYNPTSYVDADYLLATLFLMRDTYIFLAKDEKNDCYFCRSLFPKNELDYTAGQTQYALLYKEKVNLSTGVAQVQFDKLGTERTSFHFDTDIQ